MDKQLQKTTPEQFSNFVIFKINNSKVNIDVLFEDETLWLTQKKMAELFDTTPQNITLHLKNIYDEQEQSENTTCKEILQVQKEGSREVKRQSKHYNLKAITAVGYRVNSHRAVVFLDKFLALSDYPILLDNGKISALEAKLKAHAEYEKYRVIQNREYLSDFDKLLLDMEEKNE